MYKLYIKYYGDDVRWSKEELLNILKFDKIVFLSEYSFDVDIVFLIFFINYKTIIKDILKEFKNKKIVIGGIIAPKDEVWLKKIGIKKIFTPFSDIIDIKNGIESLL